jgi:hypothetical protein
VELTEVPKSGARKRKNGGSKREKGGGKENKMGPAPGRQATAGHQLALASPTTASLFSNFLVFFFFWEF